MSSRAPSAVRYKSRIVTGSGGSSHVCPAWLARLLLHLCRAGGFTCLPGRNISGQLIHLSHQGPITSGLQPCNCLCRLAGSAHQQTSVEANIEGNRISHFVIPHRHRGRVYIHWPAGQPGHELLLPGARGCPAVNRTCCKYTPVSSTSNRLLRRSMHLLSICEYISPTQSLLDSRQRSSTRAAAPTLSRRSPQCAALRCSTTRRSAARPRQVLAFSHTDSAKIKGEVWRTLRLRLCLHWSTKCTPYGISAQSGSSLVAVLRCR